ncbi:MAG TPA: dienelactone hydrolase family protein [Candidatus Acidoferrum sp.]|nr:dienelactone hydrolase family protein [Candidatus Acidoferrum sp.]
MFPTLQKRASVAIVGLLFLLFFSPVSVPAQTPPIPVEVTFSSGGLVLHGFLYKPEGHGPFPAVLWNHGSERRPGWLPELASIFLNKGYVFFIPHRRGQGRSPGEYVMDLLDRAKQSGGPQARDKELVELMEQHLQDQVAALSYLKGLPDVDPQRIAVAGCSFGGIQTVLMAEKGLGLRAAVDFAGAAQNWQYAPELRARMIQAVQHSQMPIFFIQAKNDYDTSPSRDLAAAMEKSGKPHDLQIFSSFGKSNQDAHEFCVHGGEIWAPHVFSFLTHAMQ